jgi:hypothetical protein
MEPWRHACRARRRGHVPSALRVVNGRPRRNHSALDRPTRYLRAGLQAELAQDVLDVYLGGSAVAAVQAGGERDAPC